MLFRSAQAQEQGLNFRVRGSRVRVNSDIKLLRRILQNFLTNAFRYAKGPVRAPVASSTMKGATKRPA